MRVFPLVALWAAVTVAGCTRPIDVPPGGTFINQLEVRPEFVRDGVPVEMVFRVSGRIPAEVTYSIGGQSFSCTPEAVDGGRFRCVHPSLDRINFEQGTVLVVVEAVGEGGRTSIAEQITIDFDCPRFLSFSSSAPIAEPGADVTVNVEASEILSQPPRITRLGRLWDPVVGDGRSWSVTRRIGDQDPSERSDIVARLVDRAGNSTDDCDGDGHISFAVDHTPPVANVQGILLRRDAPGFPAFLSAEPGTFGDDVGLDHVRVLDETGMLLIARLSVKEDGSIEPTSLGAATASRVLVEALDRFGRRSPRLSIPERWRLSVGAGNTAGAAVRSAVRYSPATPGTASMRNRTVELAPDLAQADARTAVVRASIGFEKVGDLPTRYEQANRIQAGYDPANQAIVAAGGYDGTQYVFYAEYMSDVLVIRWDEREGKYLVEQGPTLSYDDPEVPSPRYGVNMAFDGRGCGVLYGGDVLVAPTQTRFSGDIWELCMGPAGYEWTRIELPDEGPDYDARKLAPIVWDPANQRYVVVGGGASNPSRVLFLEPGTDATNWTWHNVTPLPTNFAGRFQNLLYVDSRVGGFATGLGSVSPIGNGEERMMWTYRSGQWTASQIPFTLGFRTAFGWAFDPARQIVTVWGGNNNPTTVADEGVWYLTETSTNGPTAWRRALIDHPVPRDYPTMIWDSDREVVVMFGGVRPQDGRAVPPEIHQIISQPSYPYLDATVDLGAPRPKGIATLSLTIRALGLGDADGVRPGRARAGGVRVLLWDHGARRWDEVARTTGGAGGIEDIAVEVTESPERYVTPRGEVPITLVPLHPATEAVDGRLEVDVIDGHLLLRSGITLP